MAASIMMKRQIRVQQQQQQPASGRATPAAAVARAQQPQRRRRAAVCVRALYSKPPSGGNSNSGVSADPLQQQLQHQNVRAPPPAALAASLAAPLPALPALPPPLAFEPPRARPSVAPPVVGPPRLRVAVDVDEGESASGEGGCRSFSTGGWGAEKGLSKGAPKRLSPPAPRPPPANRLLPPFPPIIIIAIASTVLGRFVHALNGFVADAYGMRYGVDDYWVYEYAKVGPLDGLVVGGGWGVTGWVTGGR